MGDSVQVAAIIHRHTKKSVFMYGGTFKEASKKANEDHCRKRQTLNALFTSISPRKEGCLKVGASATPMR